MIVGLSKKVKASDVDVIASSFNGNLSSDDDTVQKCLQTIDGLIISTNNYGNIDGGNAFTTYFALSIDSGGA